MQRIFVIFFMIFLPWLQTHAATTTTPAPTYTVEVLVFENRLPHLEGGELWLKDGLEPMTSDLSDAIRPKDAPLSGSALSEAAAIIQNDGDYRILAHKRWVQNAEAKSTTKPIRINSADMKLDGVLKFYLSRFLHVNLDLTLNESQRGFFGDPTEASQQTYQIKSRRRIKSRQIHYFDHPKFGALVYIEPAK